MGHVPSGSKDGIQIAELRWMSVSFIFIDMVRTLVLPAPAPATISTGPSMLVTALSWASSRPAVNAPILFSIMKRNYEKNG